MQHILQENDGCIYLLLISEEIMHCVFVSDDDEHCIVFARRFYLGTERGQIIKCLVVFLSKPTIR